MSAAADVVGRLTGDVVWAGVRGGRSHILHFLSTCNYIRAVHWQIWPIGIVSGWLCFEYTVIQLS